jgi:uncharacterized protein (DUF169 family)
MKRCLPESNNDLVSNTNKELRMDLKTFQEMGSDLYHRLHLPTYPVAVKYIKSEDEIPENAVRPSAGGQQWSLCQAITYARRWGWHSAMTEKDNFCVPSSASHQWVDVTFEELLESQVRQGWRKDRAAEERHFAYIATNRYAGKAGKEMYEKMAQYIGCVYSPLTETIIKPDAVIVYGDGSQLTHLIQALCYDFTEPVTSSFNGFGESCFKGGLLPFISGQPQVVIPGMGDRALSGTSEHEIALGIPATLLSNLTNYLFKSGGTQNMGLPVKPLLAMGLTASITPGFKYLREIVDSKAEKNSAE